MTAAALFQPKGQVAEWRLIFDHIKDLSVGDVVSYDDLSAVLGREFEPDRAPFYKANAELLDTENRGLVNLRGTGYRVITAEEHEQPAVSHHRSARRKLRKARVWIERADRAQLTPEVARRFDQMESTLRRQEDMTKRLDNRLSKVEQALVKSREEVASKQSDTEDRLEKLAAALQRAGIAV